MSGRRYLLDGRLATDAQPPPLRTPRGSDSLGGVCPSLARRMGADMTDAKKIRNEALEEAAQIALDAQRQAARRVWRGENRDYNAGQEAMAQAIAAAIRALKEPEE